MSTNEPRYNQFEAESQVIPDLMPRNKLAGVPTKRMKSWFNHGSFTLLFAGKLITELCKMSTNTQKKEILTRFIQEVWNAGEIDCSDKYLAPRYTIHHDPGDPWDGKELDLAGYKERVRLSRAPFPDQCFEISELLAEGTAVIMSWFWTGTHKGDMPGFPASNKVITMSGITIYYFNEDDRITGHWQITDRLGVFQQLRQSTG